MASQITGDSIVCSFICSKKTSKLRITGLCEENPPVTGGSPLKGPVMRKMFLFDDFIMIVMNQVVVESIVASYWHQVINIDRNCACHPGGHDLDCYPYL